jgi:signal transduction histidine kinase
MNQDEVLMRKFLRKKSFGKYNPFWEARTRIFAWYVGISAVLVGLSIPVFTQLAVIQVDNRVREDLEEEIEAFERSFHENAEKEIKIIFDRFLKHKIPGDKTFLITTVNGHFYRSSPVSLPQAIAPRSSLIQKLAKTTRPIRDREPIEDKRLGDILYKAEPVVIDGQIRGVFIVANIARGERREVFSAIVIIIQVLLAALLLALIVAWKVAKEVLRPIHTLTNTAKIITETDLTQRIPVRGRGEMAELAKTFNNMMNRIETAFISQRQLLNDASHELRTPITIIRGHLELLDVDDPQDITETVDLVIDELDRMGRFVEDLLLLAKAERKDFLILKPVDLRELTEEMYRLMQVLGDRKWHLENQARGTTILDRQRIIQAMMNLAQNAVKYTQPTDTITLGSGIEYGKIYFWVRDTGIGIPAADQQRIFDRFARSSNNQNNQSNTEGTGLGLSIVTAIAQAHKGCVELHSKLGQGSTFTLILPLKNSSFY